MPRLCSMSAKVNPPMPPPAMRMVMMGLHRHARACPGHPLRHAFDRRPEETEPARIGSHLDGCGTTWMAGTSPAMTDGALRISISLRLLRRRQKVNLMLGRERHDLGWRLLRHVVDAPEEIVQTAGRRHPEQALHDPAGLVEDAVRQAHWQAHEIARIGLGAASVEHQLELTLEHVDEFVLRRMDMRRHERVGRKRRVPRERTLAHLLRHVGLPEDVPGDVVEAFARLGDSRGQNHVVVPSCSRGASSPPPTWRWRSTIAGFVLNSALVPRHTTRPFSSTTCRSAMRSSAPMFLSMTRIDSPLAFNPARHAQISARISG